jgi:type II secretory pathway predicted ATPase ExeA
MNQRSYFNFSESPFQDVPDQKSLFITRANETVLAELVDFINTRQGLAMVIGDAGTGKTTLVSALVQRLPQSIRPFVITRPAAEPISLIVDIARAMDINIKEENLVDLTLLADAVHAFARQGKFFAVIIDDAHLLTDRHLDEIWILSQMELHGQHLLPMVLVGCKELGQKLDGHANQHLRQLIHLKITIDSLTPAETILYIDHRLRQEGSSFEACFADDCSDQFFPITAGIPRRINQMCHQALERCWHEGLPQVTRNMLWEEEPEHPQKPPDALKEPGLPEKAGDVAASALMTALGMAAVALVTALAIYAIYHVRALKAPLPATDISSTASTAIPGAPTKHTPPAPVAAAPASDHDQTGPKAFGQPAPSSPNLQASRKPEISQPLPEAGAAPGTQPDHEDAEPKTSSLNTVKVTPENINLTKIAAKYYSDNKAIGFVAIILANPQIKDENLIYAGQELFLPKVEANREIITLNDKQHYLLYNRYSDISLLKNTVSKLNERKVRFLIRETHNIGAGNIYRIFIGGYEREEDLLNALTVAETK